jgi:steroid delta-isomerase-like uncharacterized protein
MTRAEIEALYERRQLAWQRRDPAALGTSHAEDGIVKSPIFGTVKGRAAITTSYENLFEAFADWTYEPTRLLIDGATVAQSFHVQATHTADLFGVPPTGRRCELHGVLFFELDGEGKISREDRFYDFTSLLLQLGVLKAKPGF